MDGDDFPNDPSLDEMKESRTVDTKREHFPLCLVWCPIPLITPFLPFVGHAGIVASDGTIFDYACDYDVNTDPHITLFGHVAKYWPIDLVQTETGAVTAYDDAIENARKQFSARPYNFFMNNCHDFVCAALNEVHYQNKKWNNASIALGFLQHGKYVSTNAILRTWLPTIILLFLIVVILFIFFDLPSLFFNLKSYNSEWSCK